MSAQGFSILPGPLLARRTSMGLGGHALAEIRVEDPARLDNLPEALQRIGGRPEILGGGSNIIAADGSLPLCLLSLADETVLPGREIHGRVELRAGGGARLPVLLAVAARLGLSGLEGLSGIPGSVGGAVAMNAGSYGVEIFSRLARAQVFGQSAGLLERGPEGFAYGYRHCALRGNTGFFLIASATFLLTPSNPKTVRAAIRETLKKKRATQPVAARSAGCVFKNPAGTSAGKLLDEAGMKGRAVGGMRFSTLHANFMLNTGLGTGAQALELLEMGREAVFRRHGLRLETEVRLWP